MIEIKGLTKCYGKNTAVNNISFNFEQGKIYGFFRSLTAPGNQPQ